ncbi:MAG: alpha/beta hydrolase [Mariprofundaceae bacterium]
MSGKVESVSFHSTEGHSLAARLHRPEQHSGRAALFAHCFTCSKDTPAASRISRALAELGFAVLRFDFTGLGSSEGDFSESSFSSNVADVEAAAGWLADQDLSPQLLIGHSLGGAAVLAAASRIASVEAVATLASPSDPSHITHMFAGQLQEIESNGAANVDIAGRAFTVKRAFVDDLSDHDLLAQVRDLNQALLIFHSPEDAIVDIEHARRIYAAAHHPKSFISLAGGDHMLSNPADAAYAANVIAAWAKRYITPSQTDQQKADILR